MKSKSTSRSSISNTCGIARYGIDSKLGYITYEVDRALKETAVVCGRQLLRQQQQVAESFVDRLVGNKDQLVDAKFISK